MVTIILRSVILALFVLPLFQCARSTSPAETPPEIVSEETGDPIFIRDRLGKEWDITHAARKYGFKPDNFQYGVGQFATPPLTDPIFVDAESTEYPNPDDEFLTLGHKIGSDVRAYATFVMFNFEVANDRYGSTPVLAAY